MYVRTNQLYCSNFRRVLVVLSPSFQALHRCLCTSIYQASYILEIKPVRLLMAMSFFRVDIKELTIVGLRCVLIKLLSCKYCI